VFDLEKVVTEVLTEVRSEAESWEAAISSLPPLGVDILVISFITLSALSGLANTASAPQLMKNSMSFCI